MRHELAFADDALAAWATWVRGNQGAWPARTLLGRIIDQGVSGAGQCSEVQGMPESVLQTDQAVAHVQVILQHVIKVYYLTHASSEIKAEQCQCSRATFWRRVERGQFAVYGYLLTCETVIPNFRLRLEIVCA
jgi:hypothetical protein